MKIHNVAQGSTEWLQARAGIITASEMDNLITPLWEPRKGEGVEKYLALKAAERWLGSPITTFAGSGATLQGNLGENEIRNWFALTHDVDVEQVGFVTDDSGSIGCSPDGLIPSLKSGMEAKHPEPPAHVRYLMEGEVPKDYRAQVQTSMYVTGAGFWYFISYCRRFPQLCLKAPRDEEAMKAIAAVVETANAKIATKYARILSLNDGKPCEPLPEVEIRTMPGFTEAELAHFINGD